MVIVVLIAALLAIATALYAILSAVADALDNETLEW